MKKFRGFRKKVALGLLSLLTVTNMAFGVGFAKAESNSSSTSGLAKLNKSKTIQVLSQQHYKDSDKVRVVVELEGDPAIILPTKQGVRYKDLSEKTQSSLQTEVKNEQSNLLSAIKSKKIDFNVQNTFTTVINGISGDIAFGKISELEKLPNVKSVTIVNKYERPKEKPTMITSKNMVQAIQTWNAGYNGKGMVVGIIDTGIDSNHPDMKLSADTKPKLTSTNVSSLVKTNSLQGKYYTAKVPYGYNYADKNSEILDLGPDATMHGMHVAGIVGANGDETKNGIKGIAPEAQLLALKVFSNDPGMISTFGDIYIKAIDDGIILGADVMNMSLGAPAGYVNPDNLEQQAIDRAVNNGVLMSISAGNEAQIGDGNSTNPYATNPDIGMVGDPGLYPNSLAVASIENDKITLNKMMITIGSETLPIAYKTQESPDPIDVFGKNVDKDVVFVGDGSAAQYAGKDVKGKIVFAVRTATDPNYAAIQHQAEAAGAAGVIIRGHASHGDYVSMALDSPTIPLVTLSQSDGNTLQTKIKAAGGVGKVTFTGELMTVVNSAAGTMSAFSSWGVTPDLELKPEITAPGGQIYSTLNDGKYGVMSGTSMAAPHVSGGSALVLQRVHELFPALKGADAVKRAKVMLMNTAKIISNPTNSNIPYSPRQQGAGMMQLYSAVTTPVYVVNKGTNEGKIELKEINADKFTMTVTATNFSDKDITYNVGASVLTDATTGSGSNTRLALKEKVISNAKVVVDTPKVTLFAGASRDITVQIDLTNAKAELEKAMANGYFVEGFITLTSDDQDKPNPNITVPYVGFKGDWNKPSVLDPMIYDTGSYYGISGMVDQDGYYLGYNPWTRKYSKSLIAISPLGVGANNTITPVLSFLRNSKTVEYSITDSSGNTLRKLRTDKDQRKDYAAAEVPYTYKPYYTEWDGFINNKVAPDGLYYYQVKTQTYLPGKPQQVIKVPVIVDNTPPVVSNVAYSKKTGILAFDASDTGSGLQYFDINVDGKLLGNVNPGTSTSFKVNIGTIADGSKIEVVAHDYAENVSKGVSVTSPGDVTIPYIYVISPEALDVFDSRDIPLSGYVTDDSKMDYLKVSSDKLVGSSVNLALVYNSATKRYEFNTNLKFSADGVHDLYFEGSDIVGNKIAFRRQIIVDTVAPTLKISGLPANNFVGSDEKAPVLTVTVADNFDDIRLLVNGSEEYTHDFDEPFAMRSFSYDYKYTPVLKPGANEFKFQVEDLGGHIVTQTITITKGDATTQNAPKAPTVNKVGDSDKKITGKAEAGSKITVMAGKTKIGTGTADKNGAFSITIKTQKAGTVLSVTATGKNGKVSSVTKVTVKDKTPPKVPTINILKDNSKKITGKAEPASKVTVKVGKTVLGKGTADKNGNFSITIKTQKSGKVISVSATDKAGNVSKIANVTVKHQKLPKVVSVKKVKSSSTKITGKAQAGVKVYVKAGKKVIGSVTANKSGNYSIKIKKQKAGTVLSVYAKDKAGNIGNSMKVSVKKL